ncbi:glycosyltransferase [Simiduia sp. 21SJ11W-1]|uniref:glycosyltransferase family protein n=1 Tax=Simiduia sp. 21SJ11W-1 TaxID=2909669 RepID=UPI00209EE895|nr:glycosyltransferase [Simiduia sp. 21SJ11W-1]UTA49546.1 glycosyltransferase [Simiduia sp. 21SJ11W-1]
MKSKNHSVFVFNLLQDVNILRPLVYLASSEIGSYTTLLITEAFCKRDQSGAWMQELKSMSAQTGSRFEIFGATHSGISLLSNRSGMIFSGSESNLNAHKPVHDLFLALPENWLKVTLQHGFECVGFMQSRDQNLAHGTEVTFAADVICGWCSSERLYSIAPSQRSKLFVTGPTSVLHSQPASKETLPYGIVCENLHSPRMKTAGDFKNHFVDAFGEFSSMVAENKGKVVLRPHPGGQYILKNDVPIPENVIINNHPSYKVDFSRYAYGISAPSSVLIDMLLAKIPVAVWRDEHGKMDAGNYAGLTEVSNAKEWFDFAGDAMVNRQTYIERQEKFLNKLEMPTQPSEVYSRYRVLFESFSARSVEPFVERQKKRILFIANGIIPTIEISFFEPLKSDVAAGSLEYACLTESEIRKRYGKDFASLEARDWAMEKLFQYQPTHIVFCRYSGPFVTDYTAFAKQRNVPVMFHIDDDLLSIPKDFGETKYNFHNDPSRLSTVRHLLDNANLVYSSTVLLKERLEHLGARAKILAGKIYCSGKIVSQARKSNSCVVGYMGHSEKFEDLMMMLPALTRFMREHDDVRFELFGSIAMPKELEEFGDRVSLLPGVQGYELFLRALAERRWDIGICPLKPTQFNKVKANTKWLDYTAVGAAVIASSGLVYDECCRDDCGLLANTQEEWSEAFNRFYNDREYRYQVVRNAQEKVMSEYSIEQLRLQVLSMIDEASISQVSKTRLRSGVIV